MWMRFTSPNSILTSLSDRFTTDIAGIQGSQAILNVSNANTSTALQVGNTTAELNHTHPFTLPPTTAPYSTQAHLIPYPCNPTPTLPPYPTTPHFIFPRPTPSLRSYPPPLHDTTPRDPLQPSSSARHLPLPHCVIRPDVVKPLDALLRNVTLTQPPFRPLSTPSPQVSPPLFIPSFTNST